ncbi:MAG: LD-carboxypeptidase [Alphaproteobacteria bacterium]|nr:LD-carboxypeptidase [Alphaproteobacteria bacterium]
MTILKPPYLKKFDKIAFIAPSGCIEIGIVENAITIFKDWGFHVDVSPSVGRSFHYFSGSDDDRLQDLQFYLDDPHTKAIFCVRGGYGLSRIIDALHFEKFIQNPKWVIGFSDITVLLWHIAFTYNMQCLHAPMASAFNNIDSYYYNTLKYSLIGEKQIFKHTTHSYNILGSATAPLIGGNLAIIAHLIGSDSLKSLKGYILFLEDVGEYLYNIDRMLIQLKRAGIFEDLKGLILGGFTNLKDTQKPFGESIDNILNDHFKDANFPVCYKFPVSHVTENVALKINAQYELHVLQNEVILREI